MSFPNKSDRKTCWESRDKYWECLDKHNVGMDQPSPEECQQVRKLYESMCPNQWVKHFDRKRNYLLFKAKIETEGYDPLQDNAASSVAPLGTARKQRPFKPVNIIRACHHLEAKANNETETKPYYEPNVVNSGIKLSERLIAHLQFGLNSIEGQTLCSTAYCALFVILPEEYCEVRLRNLKTTLSCFLLQQTTHMENNLTNTLMITHSLEERRNETRIATLISGVFQTNLLDKCHLPENSKIRQLAEAIMLVSFKITTKACLTYSCSTFVHFRNLHSILVKLTDWECCDRIIGDVQNVLLFVIFNNWENLLTGIREINLKIWKLFLNILDKSNAKHQDLFSSITDSIFKFPWNKAKYFVLTEIIPHLKCDIVEFLNNNPMCFSGVEYSLRQSSLVSAGCDLYKTILNEFKSFKDWSDFFLALFYDVMSGNKTVAQSNLLNYWIPVTIKKYPELIEDLLDFLYECNVKNSNLSPLLSIMTLARKSGLILADWDSNEMKHDYKKVIEVGLVHINEDIRSRAIQVVCVAQKSNMPTVDEFRKMKVFLEYNINSDSTGFRQNNLNCFTIFLTRIRDSCLNILKNAVIVEKESNVQCLNEIEAFFIWIHEFLIQNLGNDGNYQRKILSLQIYDVILRYLCGGYKDRLNIQKSLCRKGNLRDQGWKVAAFLEDRKKWLFNSPPSIKALISCISDSTNDIREIAVDILVQYFINEKTFKRSRENFFINGIILCNSRMFYEAECGCLMFKMLAYLNRGRPELNDPIQKIIHPFGVCEYLLNKAWEQFTYQETDLLLSIYNNQPLHGMIAAIDMYITHSDQHLAFKFISALKKFLGTVTNHFINILSCKSEACNMVTPPSFAEMGESIEYIIRSSGLKPDDGEKEKTEHLSNAHQLLLNNIWLNLKACCDLSSTLIIHQTGRLQDSDIAALLDINISVLTRCRHKGAIESAGTSLGRSVKHLTSLDNLVYDKIISDILREFLAQSTSENVHGGSVTRKSAGLSILVHRIVSNDSEIGKPLFYLAMDVLLRVLSKSEVHHEPSRNVAALLKEKDTSVISDDIPLDIANERDVPLARALHLLCRTVLESSLANNVIQFAPQLATVCFNHLINDQWQVRNAALQLYGALVPKLIGQRKSQGEDNFVKSCVSPDELFSHVPSLWNYIKDSLQEASIAANTLTAHSNIVPILSLLSSMANRYAVNQYCLEETEKFGISVANLDDIFPNLIMLIGSPIYNIRNISATITASFYDLTTFVDHWNVIKNCLLRENELHGYMLTLKQHVMYYISFKNYLFKQEEQDEILNTLKTVLDNMNMISVEKNSSFIVKALHLEIEQLLNEDQRDYVKLVGDGFETLTEYNDNVDFQIGIHHWMQLNVVHAIQNCHEFELLPILKQCVNSNSAILVDLDFWSVVKGRIDCSLSSDHKTLQEIFEYLIELSCERKKRVSKLIYEILYVLSANCGSITYTGLLGRIYCNLYIEDVMQSYHYGYLLPLICSMACDKDISCTNTDLHLELSKVCKQLSKPERFEAANRRMAAVSMKHLVKLLQYYRQKNIDTENVHEIKCNILVACLWLLQDEDSSLRTECSRMYLLRKDSDVLSFHPNIHIGTILSASYLQKIFCGSKSHIISFLQTLLKEINANTYKKMENDLQNPFDHNTPNVYWEPMLMYKNAMKLKMAL